MSWAQHRSDVVSASNETLLIWSWRQIGLCPIILHRLVSWHEIQLGCARAWRLLESVSYTKCVRIGNPVIYCMSSIAFHLCVSGWIALILTSNRRGVHINCTLDHLLKKSQVWITAGHLRSENLFHTIWHQMVQSSKLSVYQNFTK